MKKTMYRIELKSMEWHIAKDIAILAAFSNGSDNKLTIEELATAAKIKNAELAALPFTITLSGKDLLIDRKTENLLHLTEIEVMALEDEDAPSLNRYSMDNPGLDETNLKALIEGE